MPTFLANIVGAMLSVGGVATVISVPLSLAQGIKNKNQVEKRKGQAEHANVTLNQQEPVITQQTEEQAPKAKNEWGIEDFKKYCYGNFLKHDREGELLVCLSKEDSEITKPLFYLWWGNKTNFHFGLIKKIQAGIYGNNWTINFDLEKNESRKLVIPKTNQNGLTSLNTNSLQQLQEYCKESKKIDEHNYQLKCTGGSFVSYEKKATKINLD